MGILIHMLFFQSIQKAGVVEQEDFGDASHSSDSQSDIPLNRRLTPCS